MAACLLWHLGGVLFKQSRSNEGQKSGSANPFRPCEKFDRPSFRFAIPLIQQQFITRMLYIYKGVKPVAWFCLSSCWCVLREQKRHPLVPLFTKRDRMRQDDETCCTGTAICSASGLKHDACFRAFQVCVVIQSGHGARCMLYN